MTRWTIFLFFTTVLASTIAHGQNPKNTFGLTYSPNTYHYGIKSTKGFDHKYLANDNYLAGGLDLTFHFAKKSAINFQLLLTEIKYTVDYAYIFQQPGDPYIPRQSEMLAKYLEIPITYNYYLFPWGNSAKMNVCYNAGLNFIYLNHSTDKTTFEDNSVRNSGYLNPFIFGLEAGVVWEIHFTQKTTLKFGGEYGFMLKGIDKIMYQNPTRMRGTISLVSKIDWKCFFKKGAWRPLPTCD